MASSYSLTKEELLSSRPSRQIDSGDYLEQLEEPIALRLGLFVDDDEANMADIHQNLRFIVFRMNLSRNGRIHEGNAKLLPLNKTSTRKTLDIQVISGRLTEIMMDSLLIVTFLDLQRRTLKDGMYRTLYQIIH